MKILRSIILILGFIVFTTANANTQPKDKQQNNSPALQQQLAASQEEARLLKVQLQLIKSYQDNLLSTVYWSLGVLAAIAVGLVGFGWFANFRIYERDKIALSQELRAVGKEEIRKHTAAIPELIEANTKQKFVTIQRELNNLKSDVQQRLGDIEIAILEMKHKEWAKTGVFTNAITSSADLLRKALERNESWRIANYLELIRQDLAGVMSKNQSMFTSNISALVKLLDDTNSEHAIAVNLIKELLSKVSRAKSTNA